MNNKTFTLGIISPSFGPGQYFKDRINDCVKNAERLGFKVKFMKHALNSNGYISDTAENRAKDLMSAFLDKEIDIVMTMVGGNHSSQILKFIDWDIIKNNPKPFIGYSDITVLHHAIYQKTGLRTFYGLAFITQFLRIGDGFKYTFDYLNKILINKEKNIKILPSKEWTDDFVDWGGDNQRDKKFIKNNGWKWLKSGKFEGKIIGGCVPSINHLLGTEYLIDSKDKIFFLDIPEDFSGPDVGLTISNLDAYLSDLDNIGVFDEIKGLIIGRAYKYSEEDIKEMEKLILNYTKGKDYPILIGVDLGHTDPMITIPYLSEVELDSDKNLFLIKN